MLPNFNEGDIWQSLQRETRPIVIYGMGNGADKLIERLERHGIAYADFFASDGFVRGHTFHSKRVLSFSEIREKYNDFVILLSFATNKPDVLSMLYKMREDYRLLMPDLPVAGDTTFDVAFYKRHQKELLDVLSLWRDDASASVYLSVLNYKLSGDICYLKNAYQSKEEIYNFLPLNHIRCCMDVGAYRGDTLTEMMTFFPHLQKAIAIEPDKKSYVKLKSFANAACIPIKTVNAAAWNQIGETVFHQSGNRNSSLVGASHEHDNLMIPLMTVDSLTSGERIDYIKYDVEGAEAEALLGSSATIQRDRPILAVSIYHRTEDIFALPLLMKALCPDYSFILRRTECLPAWEMTAFAIPNELFASE